MKTRTIQVYSDPSHAWAKVSLSELIDLEIAHKISKFSYCKQNKKGLVFVYLEEDCDLSLYVNALKAKNITYKFKENIGNKSSKIRNYYNYDFNAILNSLGLRLNYAN